MKKIQSSVLTVAFIFINACSTDLIPAPASEDTLTANFESMYLATHGLDFPPSKEILDKCKEIEDQSCLRTFYAVKSASESIQSLRSTASLRKTLSIIESSCVSENEEIANFVCYGGIISLYFYNSSEEDTIILDAVKNYPKKIKNIFFNRSFAWQANRPDSSHWIDFISNAEIDWETIDAKAVSIEWFTKESSRHEWMDIITD